MKESKKVAEKGESKKKRSSKRGFEGEGKKKKIYSKC